jgi:ComF family protein
VCWTHEGTGSAIVHALKYGGWHAVARDIGDRLARIAWPAAVVCERQALIPVPLSPARARERGFNQSERLAHFLGDRLGIPVWNDVLERSRATETQTRLTAAERQANVSGAFGVRDDRRLRDAHVVLVDDVVTTAATLNECAAAMVAGGIRAVSYVTFGRAPAPEDRRTTWDKSI